MELELELLFFIPKELELELNVKELELNWKKGIDPSPVIDKDIDINPELHRTKKKI